MTPPERGTNGGEGTPLRPPRQLLLWTSLLATPALWVVYFMGAYVFTEATCGAATAAAGGIGVPVRILLVVATVLVAGLSGLATAFAWTVRRRALRSRPVYDDFLPHVGFFTGLLFTFVTAAHLVPIAMLGACA